MEKNKKIWLWLGLVLFAIPEILWSPVGNFVYSLIMPTVRGSVQLFRHNFLVDTAHPNLLSSILLVQFVGAILFTMLNFSRKNTIGLFMAIPGLIISIVILILFGLSIKLRSIGF